MKTKTLKKISGLIIMVMLLSACGPTEISRPVTTELDRGENDGPMAPEFELEDMDGNKYQRSDLEGEKVYLKYWASWCSICLAGLSEIDELSAMETDFKVFTVVTPGANGEQSKEDFIKWFNGLEYENIVVLFDEDGELGKQLNVRAFPTSVFLGSDGKIIEGLPGHKSNEEIIEKIKTFY